MNIKPFPVISINREYVKNRGYDVDLLDDNEMLSLAETMAEEILSGDIHKCCLESGSDICDAALERAWCQLFETYPPGTYTASVVRTAYSYVDVTFVTHEEKTGKELEGLATDLAADMALTEKASEYEVESIQLKS